MRNNKLIGDFQKILPKIDGFHLIQKQWNASTVSYCYVSLESTCMKMVWIFFGLLVMLYAWAESVETRLPAFVSKDSLITQAVQASKQSLESKGHKPAEFYVRVEDKGEDIEVSLTHQEDTNSVVPVVGGGSGKSQVCKFNKAEQKVTGCLYFQ